jgi:hypothetical protein
VNDESSFDTTRLRVAAKRANKNLLAAGKAGLLRARPPAARAPMRVMRLTAFLALFLGLLVASATCQEVEDLAPELEACRAQVRTSDVYRQD